MRRFGETGASSVNSAVSHSGTKRRLADDPALLCVGVFALLAVVVYAPLLIVFIRGMLRDGLSLPVVNVDFANYWMAGRLVLTGEQQDLFTFPVYFAHLQAVFGPDYPIHNWGYPPHFLLLLWPFGLLEYKAALLVFLASSFALFAIAVAVFRRTYAPHSDRGILALAILGFTLMMVFTVQNGFLTGAALLFGLAWMKSRPAAAGMAFALLTIKPQLGLLIPVLLLLDRNWRTIGWSVFFSVALIGLSAVLFGVQSWFAYLTETLSYQRSVMTDWDGIFLRMMPTAFASVRTLGFRPDTAYLVQWPVSIAAAALVLWAWRCQTDPLQRIFTLTCGTFVISPYAFNYDMGALTVIAAILVGSQPLNRLALITVSLVAALSASVTNLGRSGLPIAPLILGSALAALGIDRKSVV